MAPKSGHLIFVFFCVVAIAFPILAASIAGGWQPIEKPNENTVVVDVAKSAVAEYNKEKNKALIFLAVVEGQKQVVAGIRYKFTISAENAKATGAAALPYNYTADVWSKLDKSIQLISLKKEIHTHNF